MRRPASLGDDFERTLRGARRGRQRAWDAIYRDLAPPLLGYLRVQGASSPEDLVGEVFLEVVRSLPRFDGGEAGFRSWVFTIAHRRLVDDRRSATRRATEPVPSEDLEPALPPVDDETPALERASTEEVLALLGRLGEDQREVLVLRLVGGFTTAEVAAMTDRSEEAVKGLAKRGLARLRTLLGVQAPSPEGAQQADTGNRDDDPPPPSDPDAR